LLSSAYNLRTIFSVSFYSFDNLSSTLSLTPRSQIYFAYSKYSNALITPNKNLVFVDI